MLEDPKASSLCRFLSKELEAHSWLGHGGDGVGGDGIGNGGHHAPHCVACWTLTVVTGQLVLPLQEVSWGLIPKPSAFPPVLHCLSPECAHLAIG